MRRILDRLGQSFDKALGIGILLVFGALLIVSICHHIPALDAPEALTPLARYLSFALLALSIVCLLLYSFPHLRPEAVFVGLPGLIVSILGIRGGIARLGAVALFLGLCVVVTLLLWQLGELWQRLVATRGWTWTSWVAMGLSLVWTLFYSLIGLALVGSAAYLVYFGFTADLQGDIPWLVFPLMSILPAVFGWVLVTAGIRSARETLRER